MNTCPFPRPLNAPYLLLYLRFLFRLILWIIKRFHFFFLHLIDWAKLLSFQTRNRFEGTRSEVESLMKKMKENPLEHKTISPYTMEGYLYVQEKRKCSDCQGGGHSQPWADVVSGGPCRSVSTVFSPPSALFCFLCARVFLQCYISLWLCRR